MSRHSGLHLDRSLGNVRRRLTHLPGGGFVGPVFLEASGRRVGKEWVRIVASCCQWTFATGPHAGASVSERVVEWGPSAPAIVGLVVAVAGVGSWMGLRTEHMDDVRTDRG